MEFDYNYDLQREFDDSHSLICALSYLLDRHATAVRGRRRQQRPRWWLEKFGPTKRQRAQAREDAEVQAVADRYQSLYRRQFLRGEVSWAAWRLSSSMKSDRTGRFWMDSIMDQGDCILADLRDSKMVREFCQVNTDDVRVALDEDRAARPRRAEAPLLVDAAIDQSQPTGLSQRELVGQVIPVEPIQDTFLRWWVKGETGLVQKISVNARLQGLGLGRRMLFEMVSAHPEVTTWNTTPQNSDSGPLFDHMRELLPQYGWKNGALATVRLEGQ